MGFACKGSLHEICMQRKLVTGLCVAYMLMSSQPCLQLSCRASQRLDTVTSSATDAKVVSL